MALTSAAPKLRLTQALQKRLSSDRQTQTDKRLLNVAAPMAAWQHMCAEHSLRALVLDANKTLRARKAGTHCAELESAIRLAFTPLGLPPAALRQAPVPHRAWLTEMSCTPMQQVLGRAVGRHGAGVIGGMVRG